MHRQERGKRAAFTRKVGRDRITLDPTSSWHLELPYRSKLYTKKKLLEIESKLGALGH